jgi:hypothetical protein
MLLTEYVDVKINSCTSKYYKSKGYIIPTHIDKKGRECININDIIIVKVEDLTNASTVKIKVQCDYCYKEYEIKYVSYKRGKDNSIINMEILWT